MSSNQTPAPAGPRLSSHATDSSDTLGQGTTGDQTADGAPSTAPQHRTDAEKRQDLYADEKFEVSFDGPDDPDNPKSKTMARKWLISLLVSFSSFCVTMNSTMYTVTYDQIIPKFSISEEVATLGLSIFVVGLAVGPLFLAPLSEFYGRRLIYIGAFVWIFLFIIPCAVAQNIQTIIVTRFFDGVGCSVFLSVAGGTIGDIFTKEQLSMPMMVYSGSPFLGPALGPVVGGFINYNVSWRWTFWVLLIWTGVQLSLIILFVPETYAPVILRRKAERKRKETGDPRWHAPIEKMDRSVTQTILQSCTRPFELLFYEPMVLNLCILSALLLGILYLFFGAYPLIFRTNYNFNLWQIGLTFLGLAVGMISAILSDPLFRAYNRRLLRAREARTGEIGVTEPEFRLPPTVVGAQLVWIGLFGFAWTSYSFVPWIAPCLFSIVVGAGIVLCYAGIFTFLVESYPVYAASALAANSFLRSIFAAVFPLFGRQMYQNVGFRWASSILAFLMLVMAPFPYIFFKHGKSIRKNSRFAKS